MRYVSVPIQQKKNVSTQLYVTPSKHKQGHAIQANMDVKEIDYFSPKIKLGLVYRVSGFICEPTSSYQQTISNKTSLRFGRATRFDPIQAPEIPHHYFEFASYYELQHRVPREDVRGKMQYPILTGQFFYCQLFSLTNIL